MFPYHVWGTVLYLNHGLYLVVFLPVVLYDCRMFVVCQAMHH